MAPQQPATPKQTILITGATGTLGQRIIKELANPNTHLILLDQNRRKLEKLEDQLNQSQALITLIPLDFNHLDLIEQIAEPLAARIKHLDQVHICHGMLHELTPTDQLSAKAWHQALNVNLHSVYHLVRLTFPFLRQSSNPSFTAYSCPITGAYDTAYAASKAGLQALMQGLKTEQENQKIRVEIKELPAFDSPLRRKAFPNGDPRVLEESAQ
ncbi:MAG: hypothetical protein CMM87_04420 [Rickettsiales bacterium]|nr:hypothetical protein [Rickettsiales bacterium]|tara:strand:+ start:32567 stop:33205 length:639 start_codon:yes stop_codon:yes gene_type:complete